MFPEGVQLHFFEILRTCISTSKTTASSLHFPMIILSDFGVPYIEVEDKNTTNRGNSGEGFVLDVMGRVRRARIVVWTLRVWLPLDRA